MVQLQRFSTDRLPPRERIAYWNEITCSAVTPQVASPLDRSSFCGRMTRLDLDDLRLIELQASGSVVTGVPARRAALAQRVYLVRLVMDGEITLVHGGREAQLERGDFMLCDPGRPYRVSFNGVSNILLLRISREHLVRYVARPESVTGIVMRADAGLSGLASRHLRDLWKASPDFLVSGTSARIPQLSLQLLACAFSAIPEANASHTGVAAGHRARIVEFIERHLAEANLSPQVIAGNLGITSGYLHRLFSCGQETVVRYIIRRRLEECANALKDPLQNDRKVTAIAFSLGFNSVSHFSRLFHARYGLSPTRFRREQF